MIQEEGETGALNRYAIKLFRTYEIQVEREEL